MVIFHSYVKLPEGKVAGQFFQHTGPTMAAISHGTPPGPTFSVRNPRPRGLHSGAVAVRHVRSGLRGIVGFVAGRHVLGIRMGEIQTREVNPFNTIGIPSGELTQQWKMAIYSGFSH